MQILDRKNSEIEDVKGHYRNKIKELEEIITKLERKSGCSTAVILEELAFILNFTCNILCNG